MIRLLGISLSTPITRTWYKAYKVDNCGQVADDTIDEPTRPESDMDENHRGLFLSKIDILHGSTTRLGRSHHAVHAARQDDGQVRGGDLGRSPPQPAILEEKNYQKYLVRDFIRTSRLVTGSKLVVGLDQRPRAVACSFCGHQRTTMQNICEPRLML